MAKVEVNIDFKELYSYIDKHTKFYIKKNISDMILKMMNRGVSPVEGHGKYKAYSDSYKKQIQKGKYSRYGKTQMPINLKLSGKLHRSIKVRITSKGVHVWFSDKKAKFHDTPGIARVLRKMLPTGNETFSEVILLEIEKNLAKIVKKSFK